MKHYVLFILLIVALATGGCKKGGKTEEKPPEDIEIMLSSPAQNELCTTGEVISASQSKVTFKWQHNGSATAYTLVIEDLLTHQATFDTVKANTFSRVLKRNNPYSWRVVAKIGDNFAQSIAWRFYNAGVAITGYAPFPAVAYSPRQGQNVYDTNTVILEWLGSAVDNNIKNYDVYFGTTTSPPLLLKETEKTFTDKITVDKKVYYWKVVTSDKNGNTSESQLYQFSVL